MRVDNAGSLEMTLARLRQRYALHFHLPPGVKAGEERQIDVELASAARRRYPGADVRFRRSYVSQTDSSKDPVLVSQQPVPDATPSATAPSEEEEQAGLRRRPGISEPRGTKGPMVFGSSRSTDGEGGWKRAGEPAPAVENPPAETKPEEQPRRGWRKLKPGEEP
jgi:hypothetical protein